MLAGVVLFLAAAVALALANSALGPQVAAFWQEPPGFLRAAGLGKQLGPGWFVADILMPVFFFSVGLEIRSELSDGVLSHWRRAALPLAATLGGILAPALIYLVSSRAPELRAGWGVPIATDIAFALGVLSLLGRRVPHALRVLLLSLAVLDDLGAIAVIALFYSKGLAPAWLGLAGLGVGWARALQRFRVRSWLAYMPAALLSWVGCHEAGIHPTIAGVALGLVLRDAPRGDGSPTLRARLKPWVELLIMPIFALANAGVVLAAVSLTGHAGQVALSVGLGLFLGKPLGVVGLSLLSVRLGFARLPVGVGASGLIVLGVVAGVGFTMSLFVAQLAFVDAQLLGAAKLGVVCASALAACLALVLGHLLLPRSRPD